MTFSDKEMEHWAEGDDVLRNDCESDLEPALTYEILMVIRKVLFGGLWHSHVFCRLFILCP